MRRIVALTSVVAVMLLGGVALRAMPNVSAQDATPASSDSGQMAPAGLTYEPLGLAVGVDLPSPADLFAARLRLEPGSTLPLLPDDPTGGLLVVESGVFTIEADTSLSVMRAGAMTAESNGMPPMETTASGDVVTLEMGDSAYIPGSITGELRNDGDVAAVGLAFLAGPSMGLTGEGTPTP